MGGPDWPRKEILASRSLLPKAKRKVFFSFHYNDIMRVNNVRMSGEFSKGASGKGRQVEGFYDFSLWESKRLYGEDALRRMIREGVKSTSVICVLVGTNTFLRPWVRYEIARSVINGKGLLAVHINSIAHHQFPFQAHERGSNPCYYMGIARRENGQYYLCERVNLGGKWDWAWYSRHADPVAIPKYMSPPIQNQPTRLSEVTREYDWSQHGAQNIGAWIDMAAQDAGR